MLFTLKKFISWFLEPTNVCLLLIATGIILLWTKRYLHLGRRVLTAGLVILAIFSNGAVSRWTALSLEQRYKPIPELPADAPIPATLESARYISVLGGGGADTAGLSANNQLSQAALSRLIEGVRLMKALPQVKLIVSGSGNRGASNAEIMKQAAVALGVESTRVIQFDSPRDTMDEAESIKTVVGTDPFIVVTSAIHLPRAVALLRHLGLNPIPAPADFRQRPDEPFEIQNQLWGPTALGTNSAVCHEYVGMLWGRLRGKL